MGNSEKDVNTMSGIMELNRKKTYRRRDPWGTSSPTAASRSPLADFLFSVSASAAQNSQNHASGIIRCHEFPAARTDHVLHYRADIRTFGHLSSTSDGRLCDTQLRPRRDRVAGTGHSGIRDRAEHDSGVSTAFPGCCGAPNVRHLDFT